MPFYESRSLHCIFATKKTNEIYLQVYGVSEAVDSDGPELGAGGGVPMCVPNSYVWHIADIYNVLTGLAIFLIFVCKKRILKKLLRRLVQLQRISTK